MNPTCQTDIRVTGIVIPSDWDENGNVLAVTLQGDGEEEYRLEGKELTQYIQVRVEAFGGVDFLADGGKRLTVRRLTVMENRHSHSGRGPTLQPANCQKETEP